MGKKNEVDEVEFEGEDHDISSTSTAIDETATDVVNSTPEDTRVQDLVQSWFNDHILNSPVSRNTAAYNHLQDCLPHLVNALKE